MSSCFLLNTCFYFLIFKKHRSFIQNTKSWLWKKKSHYLLCLEMTGLVWVIRKTRYKAVIQVREISLRWRQRNWTYFVYILDVELTKLIGGLGVGVRNFRFRVRYFIIHSLGLEVFKNLRKMQINILRGMLLCKLFLASISYSPLFAGSEPQDKKVTTEKVGDQQRRTSFIFFLSFIHSSIKCPLCVRDTS